MVEQQHMQYFMLNRLCVSMMGNAFNQMLNGFFKVRSIALNFICKMIVNIASSLKRQQYMAQMHESLYFGGTKSSER